MHACACGNICKYMMCKSSDGGFLAWIHEKTTKRAKNERHAWRAQEGELLCLLTDVGQTNSNMKKKRWKSV